MAVAQVLSQSLAQNLGIQWEPSSRKPSMYTDFLLQSPCRSVCITHAQSPRILYFYAIVVLIIVHLMLQKIILNILRSLLGYLRGIHFSFKIHKLILRQLYLT